MLSSYSVVVHHSQHPKQTSVMPTRSVELCQICTKHNVSQKSYIFITRGCRDGDGMCVLTCVGR